MLHSQLKVVPNFVCVCVCVCVCVGGGGGGGGGGCVCGCVWVCVCCHHMMYRKCEVFCNSQICKS